MNDLEVIFADLMEFMTSLYKSNGEAVTPSKFEIEALKRDVILTAAHKNYQLQKNFYLMVNMKGEILFSHHIKKYLRLTDDFNLTQFFSLIDDGTGNYNYLKDYFAWAKSAYVYANKYLDRTYLEGAVYKIRIPMRCSDGNIYWVEQDCKVLELDANKNIVSQFNTYTISCKYNEKSQIGLIGEFYYDDFYQEEWSKIMAETRFFVQPFILRPIQKNILYYFYNNPNTTEKQCSEVLKYPLNTIKKYISDSQYKKGILDMAKVSFPAIEIKTLKDVISFLAKIGWLHK